MAWIRRTLARKSGKAKSYFALLVFERELFYIVKSTYGFPGDEAVARAVETLEAEGLHFVRVIETNRGRPWIPYFAAPKRKLVTGWHQTTSRLTAENPEDQAKVDRAREAYSAMAGGYPTSEWGPSYGRQHKKRKAKL